MRNIKNAFQYFRPGFRADDFLFFVGKRRNLWFNRVEKSVRREWRLEGVPGSLDVTSRVSPDVTSMVCVRVESVS